MGKQTKVGYDEKEPLRATDREEKETRLSSGMLAWGTAVRSCQMPAHPFVWFGPVGGERGGERGAAVGEGGELKVLPKRSPNPLA